MKNDPAISDVASLIDTAQKIVIVQADNPDGDSLGSALALEQILGNMGKEPYLYCGVDIPAYIRYLDGWDRVEKQLPDHFDASIIVDASTVTLLEKLQETGGLDKLAGKPCAVLDHHASTENDITFATVVINDPSQSSTGELIFHIATKLDWPLDKTAGECIMVSILGDTQGLSNDLTSAETYRVMAYLAESGIDRPALEERRRAYGKMAEQIFRYKGRLIGRTELFYDDTIATVTVPHDEITTYSPLYNPVPLIQADMLQIERVKVAIVFKTYADGKITAAIRCNAGNTIGSDLATHFGGGGHPYASGFKITDGRSFSDIKTECLKTAHELLENLPKEANHAAL